MEFKHEPVLLEETINGLNIKPNGIYVDGTLGGAGHSKKILKQLSSKGLLVGIDRDEEALKAAKENLKEFENVKYSWMDAIQEADISITQEDKDILKELGKVLGQTDADSQVNEIEVTESFLNMQIEKAEEARKKNQKMYKTLGVVVGLVFVIILI